MGKKSKQKAKLPDDLELELRQSSLVAVDIIGDGNCLFRSLSDQIYGNQERHSDIRQSICDHIQQNQQLYADFITEKDHIQNMRKDGIYGGNLELVAASRLYKRNIHVYQAGIGFWKIELAGSAPEKDPIHIAYHHEYEHYSSVRNADGPFTGLPMVKAALVTNTSNQKEVDIAKARKIEHFEEIVKKSVDLSDSEAAMVKELLLKLGNNPSAVVDFIFEERSKRDNDDTVGSKEDNPPAEEDKAPSSTNGKTKSKLTPKQRKAARNAKIAISRDKRKGRKQQVPVKEVSSGPPVGEIIDGMKSISI